MPTPGIKINPHQPIFFIPERELALTEQDAFAGEEDKPCYLSNMNTQPQRIATLFKERFNTEPVMYFSPGRINLIGEHIDYNDGYVMPAAINKGIYLAIASNGSSRFNFYAADPNEELSVTLQEIKRSAGWANYVLGVVNEFLLLGKAVKGFDCVFGGDLPLGAGMSSSAALEGGLAFAINELFGHGLNRTELALLCQRAEHGFPGVPCGIMDQFANMMGKRDQVILLDCADLSAEYLPLKLAGHSILLIYSGVHHELAAGEYAIRRKQCETGLTVLRRELNIHSFRDIKDAGQLDTCRNMMDEVIFKRCLYVVEEIGRVKKAKQALANGQLGAIGELLYETHAGLSSLYEVSCAELDFLVEQARQHGVIGARVMGGGFGGCTINIIRQEDIAAFIEKSSSAFESQFGHKPHTYLVETSDGTYRLV